MAARRSITAGSLAAQALASRDESVDFERNDGTAVITLNNPDAFNALAPNMIGDFVGVVQDAARDRSCRAIVLTGSGQKAFCAGIDVKSVADRDAATAAESSQQLDPIVAGFENLHHNLGAMIRTLHSIG